MKNLKLFLATAIFVICCSFSSYAQISKSGSETVVNTVTIEDQKNVSVSQNYSGDYAIVWESLDRTIDTDLSSVWIRIIDHNGTDLVASAIVNNTSQVRSQGFPSVALNDNGNYVVAWMTDDGAGTDGEGWAIRHSLKTVAGVTLVSESEVNTTTTGNQKFPAVAIDETGAYVIVWESEGDIKAQLYTSSGVKNGTEISVNTNTSGPQLVPDVAMDDDGDFVVVWQSDTTGGDFDIHGQRYNSSGVAQGTEYKINTTTAQHQIEPSVDMDPNGQFVVSWSSYQQDGSGYGIYATRFANDGTREAEEFMVNSTTSGFQNHSDVAMAQSGQYLISWVSFGQDGDAAGTYLQAYSPKGIKRGTEVLVNTTTKDFQTLPSISYAHDSLDLVSAWQSGELDSISTQDGSGYGIYRQSMEIGDLIAPNISSITRIVPTYELTNTTEVTYRVTFDENVSNVNASDFELSGAGAGGTASITSVSEETASTVFDVTVSTLNTDGELDLDIASGHNITDVAGNAFEGTINSEETYTLDFTAPELIIDALGYPLGVTNSNTVHLDFYYMSELVNNVSKDDFDLAGNAASGATFAIDLPSGIGVNNPGTITITGITEEGDLRIDLSQNFDITDDAGNAPVFLANNGVTVDFTSPTINAISLASDNTYVDVTFSEAVYNGSSSALDGSDFNLTLSGGAATNPVISTVTKANGNGLIGGETTVRINFSKTGTAVGNETLEVDLVSNSVFDTAGNATDADQTSNNRVSLNDKTGPGVTSFTLDDSALLPGETAVLTITFSEEVTGLEADEFTVPNGTITEPSSSDGGTTYTATYTPTAELEDATNEIVLDLTGITDGASNAGVGTAKTANFTIDTKLPTVTSISLNDTEALVGDTPELTITFSEVVTGLAANDFTVPNGTITEPSSADGGTTYTATYTPDDDVEDDTNEIILDLTGVTDDAGNAGSGTSSTANFTIDTDVPNLVGPVGYYGTEVRGILFNLFTAFEFDAEVFLTGDPKIEVDVAGEEHETYFWGKNGNIVGWYAVRFTETEETYIDFLRFNLNGGAITDNSGNAVDLTFPKTRYSDITFDGKRPTVTSMTLDDSELLPGETAVLTITFSEEVTGLEADEFTVPNGTITEPSSSDGGTTYTATYTPTAEIEDATNEIVLDLTGIIDVVNNSGDGTASTANFTLDSRIPAVGFAATISTGAESVSSIDLEVGLALVSGVDVTVDYAVTGTATGSGTDFTLADGTLTIPAGTTTENITIAVVNDAIVETDETVIVTLSNPTNAALIINSTVHTYTITDDDAATLAVGDVTLSEGNSGTSIINIPVTLTGEVQDGFTVEADAILSGDAAEIDASDVSVSSDPIIASAVLTFVGNDGEVQNLQVTLNGDEVVENDEAFQALIGNIEANGKNVTTADGDATITVTNDDAATLSIYDVSLNEGESGEQPEAVFTVTLTGTVETGISVDASTSHGTTDDGDYISPGTVTLNFTGTDGETITYKPVINGDDLTEADETFSVLLNNLNASGLNVTISDNTGAGTITNDDATPAFTSGTTTSTQENATATGYTAAASDADNGTLTFSLVGGSDQGLFSIDGSSGVLTFNSAPDFESQGDGDTNNDYVVEVKVSDGSNEATQTVTVTVTNLDDIAPVITSDGGEATASISIAENSIAVTTVTATDADVISTVTFNITGGADQSLFTISNGVLSFAAAPDFETASDNGNDNTYEVEVTATDGTNTDVQTITVTITDENDNAPIITSDGGGETASISIAENSTAVTKVTATDADAISTVTFNITGGADQGFFTISNGALSFATAPDFETASDNGNDNTYEVEVTATDGRNTDVQTITVTITDEDDNAPIITSDGGEATAALSIAENSTAVTTVTATDADAISTVSCSITGGADQGFFTITNGALAFAAAPDFETAADNGNDNTYEVEVTATDRTNTDVQTITVTITDEDDNAPIITSDGGGETASLSIAENSTAVTTVTATDADAISTVTFNITGGADQGFFTISNGALAFDTAPDFETASDNGNDNTYEVEVTATDGTNTDVQTITVTVTDEDDNAPIITSDGGEATASITIAENGTAVTTVTATDADAISTVSFNISGGAGQGFFTISNGVLSFVTAPDFETASDNGNDNTYEVEVTATDGTNTDVQTITVTITDEDDNAPIITSDGGEATASLSIAENSTSVTTVTATDADAISTVSFNITGGADQGFFTITNGALAFAAAPDFETAADNGNDNTYEVEVTATDGTNTDAQTIRVWITDEDDNAPIITSDGGEATASISIAENSTSVTTVTATDADAISTVSFNITGGADQGFFTISNGALVFATAPDFETASDNGNDNTYEVEVTATDGTNTDVQTITVSIDNVDDLGPIFSSGNSVEFAENGIGVVYSAQATDESAFTFGLGSGNDEDLFNLVAGELTFKSTPDFEIPLDANGLNDYVVELIATDALNLSTSLQLTVNVTNVDELGPKISSLDPIDEASIFAGQTLRVTFDELIQKGSGQVNIVKESNGEEVQTIDINSANVSIDGNTLIIDPPTDLPEGEELSTIIDGSAITDLLGNDITGLFNNTTWNHTVINADVTSPNLVSLSPVDGSEVETSTIVTATFDEDIFAGTGKIRIFRKADLLLLSQLDVTSSEVIFSGKTVSFQIPENMLQGAELSIHFSASSIVDASGNEIGAQFDEDTWIVTVKVDNPPQIETLFPLDGGTANPGDEIKVTFNETVQKGSGKLRVYKKNGLTLLYQTDISDASITVNDAEVTWSLPSSLPLNEELAIHISKSGLEDLGGNDIDGVFDENTWNITLVSDPAPSIVSLSPVDGGSFIPGDDLTLTLSENVSKNSGLIRVYRASDLAVLATIDVNSTDVSITDNVVVVTTPKTVSTGQDVFIHFASSTLSDSGNNDLTGVFDTETWNLSVEADPSPTISSLSPVDGGSLNEGFNITATFSESVFKNDGKIRFYRSSDNLLLSTMDINDSDIQVSGAEITITPPAGLPSGEEFFVHLSKDALVDSWGNNINGVFTTTTWNLTLIPDPAPTISTLSPTDEGDVYQGGIAIVTFSEDVIKKKGKVRIYKKNGLSLLKAIDIESGDIVVNGAEVSIQMPSNLAIGEEIVIHISGPSLEDSAGNDISGVFDETTWNLTVLEDVAPTITSLSPSDGGQTITGGAITATFSEDVFKNDGALRIYKVSDLTLLSQTDINDSDITVVDNTLSMNLPADLPEGEELLVHLSKNALKDGGINNINGLFTVNTWNFTINNGAPPEKNDEQEDLAVELVTEEHQIVGISVYPNPTTGVFNLVIEQPDKVNGLVIYDLVGNQVYQKTEGIQGKETIDLSNSPSGLYLLNVAHQEGVKRIKIMLKK